MRHHTADEMFEGFESHVEGVCPRCKTLEDDSIVLSQNLDHIDHLWDPRPMEGRSYPHGEEQVRIAVKCASCGWEGFSMFRLGPFRGYVSQEQLDLLDVMNEARDEAVHKAMREGKVCFLHGLPDCKDPHCTDKGGDS